MTFQQLVCLWIANDEALYRCAQTVVHVARDQYELAEGLKDLVECEVLAQLGEDFKASLASDILLRGLADVDFHEMAEDYWTEWRDYT